MDSPKSLKQSKDPRSLGAWTGLLRQSRTDEETSSRPPPSFQKPGGGKVRYALDRERESGGRELLLA